MASHRDETEVLLEAATSAFRERDAYGRIAPSPAWADLSPVRREELFERVLESRVLEAAADRDGLSSTGHAVLDRLDRVSQIG
jgi:hypothetical protein